MFLDESFNMKFFGFCGIYESRGYMKFCAVCPLYIW